MSERTGANMISRRRMLGILGTGVAFGIGTPAAVLTTSDAEAQTPSVDQRQNQPQDQRTVGAQPRQDQRTDATEQRQDRRTNRTRRRMARRNARRERAMARQEARNKRRMARRTGSAGKSAKGPGAKGTGSTGTGTGTTGQAPARQ